MGLNAMQQSQVAAQAPSSRARAGEGHGASPDALEAADLLVVAQVLAPHGLRGELKCLLVTDFPERFARGTRLLVRDADESLAALTVRTARVDAGSVYLTFAGVSDRDAADALRGRELLVPRTEAVHLPDGQFLWQDLIGLRVEDERGTLLGEMTQVLRTGANDVYVVRTPNGEVLVPAIKNVVRAIEPQAGRMVIALLPGMLPEPPRVRRFRPRSKSRG